MSLPTAKKIPYIVGVGGTTRANSSTEKAMRHVLQAAERNGAKTLFLDGAALDLPLYAPENPARSAAAQRFVEEIRRADGLIIGSPGYHGGISGLVKNALDYIEDLSGDPKPYLQDRAVGLVATGAGWQGAITTLAALRNVVHALRGWPTPLGVPINTIEPVFDKDGLCIAPKIAEQLDVLALQVVDFAINHSGAGIRAI